MMQIQVSDPVNSQAGVLPPASVKMKIHRIKSIYESYPWSKFKP